MKIINILKKGLTLSNNSASLLSVPLRFKKGETACTKWFENNVNRTVETVEKNQLYSVMSVKQEKDPKTYYAGSWITTNNVFDHLLLYIMYSAF